MDYVSIICEIYEIFFDQRTNDSVQDEMVMKAFEILMEAYKPKAKINSNCCEIENVPDYNNFYHCYAYLHKYAMLHTGLTFEVLQLISEDMYVFSDIQSKKQLNLCSLGGGPGTDIIALLFALKNIFNSSVHSICVVDSAQGWKFVFETLLFKLIKSYCNKGRPLPSWTQNYSYLNADLLCLPKAMSSDVYDTIKNADILTMIKFISAVSSNKARDMLKVIFYIMKQGSLLLFIDNASGGFHELMEDVAKECKECGIVSVFGPIKNYFYKEPRFSRVFHGHKSLSKTTVTIQLWKKINATSHFIQILPKDIHIFT